MNVPTLPLTRSQFVLGGGSLLVSQLVSRLFPPITHRPAQQIGLGQVNHRSPISFPELFHEEAGQKLTWWNETQRTSVKSRKSEPPLSLILGILHFRHREEGDDLDGWRKNPLHSEIQTFLGGIRVWRILQAVQSGEADDRFRQILQCELNKTGGFGPIWSQMPRFLHYQAYLKVRLLDCFEDSVLRSTPTVRDWKGYPGNIYPSCKYPLDEILALPLRDPYHERESDFA